MHTVRHHKTPHQQTHHITNLPVLQSTSGALQCTLHIVPEQGSDTLQCTHKVPEQGRGALPVVHHCTDVRSAAAGRHAEVEGGALAGESSGVGGVGQQGGQGGGPVVGGGVVQRCHAVGTDNVHQPVWCGHTFGGGFSVRLHMSHI